MPLMRRRPLLRAAAIGGGAYYAGKKRQESQQQAAYEEQAQPAAAPPPAAAPAAGGGLSRDTMTQLEQLGKLHEEGVLTDEEFAPRRRSCSADQADAHEGRARRPSLAPAPPPPPATSARRRETQIAEEAPISWTRVAHQSIRCGRASTQPMSLAVRARFFTLLG